MLRAGDSSLYAARWDWQSAVERQFAEERWTAEEKRTAEGRTAGLEEQSQDEKTEQIHT